MSATSEDEAVQAPATQQASSMAFDPREKIDNYDWDDLEARFQEDMEKCAKEEQKLTDELRSLLQYFNVWSQSIHAYESERVSKRLKTRIQKVQFSEEELEQRRQHYIKVVQAFESALSLLGV